MPQFHVKTVWNWRHYFLIILASKMKLADGFIILRGIKLWNRQSWSGKKMKLTARGFAAAVSFIFFPTNSGRFHNFSPLKLWNHSQFHFWAKITEKMPPVSHSFTWNWAQKKKGFNRKPLIFFLWPGFIDFFFLIWVVSRKCWQKNWNFGGFMEGKNKINWNHLVPRLGPRASVSAIFTATIFVNTNQNSNNNQWNPGHKNKKIWTVYHEIRHWWYFGPIWVFFCYWILLRSIVNRAEQIKYSGSQVLIFCAISVLIPQMGGRGVLKKLLISKEIPLKWVYE